jgi:hypothetical protein
VSIWLHKWLHTGDYLLLDQRRDGIVYFRLDVVFLFEARAPEFIVVYTSTIHICPCISEKEVPWPIREILVSNRKTTSSPKYNDDISFEI